MNPRLPRTLGVEPEHTNCLTVDEVDVIIESDAPLPTLPESAPTAVEHAIAEQIRPFVTDGATLQTGIGGIPSTVVEILAASGGGDYGIHSEMFTTGLMKLHKAGKITNHKGVYDGVSIATFALPFLGFALLLARFGSVLAPVWPWPLAAPRLAIGALALLHHREARRSPAGRVALVLAAGQVCGVVAGTWARWETSQAWVSGIAWVLCAIVVLRSDAWIRTCSPR